VTAYLKDQNKNILTIAADPVGSGVHDYFKTGAFTGDGGSVTEGIGIKRLTANLARAVIDDAMRITDKEMIDMLFHVAKHDGLFMGTSAALNLYGAYKAAKDHQDSGKRIVTLLCDSGSRYASKLLDQTWLEEKELVPDPLFG
jgi:cysteine synthase A